MDQKEFGRRVQLVRELLQMTQQEFAAAINTRQTLVSRLEKGFGGTCQNIFDILDLLKSKGYVAKNLFNEPFKIELLARKSQSAPQLKKALKSITEVKESLHDNYEKLVLLQGVFEEELG